MEEEKEEDNKDGSAVASPDQQDFPIMHWEELNARIEELERQEQDRTTQGAALKRVWDKDREEDVKKRRLTSRFQQKNLQLCFINDGDSEEEGGANSKVSTGTGRNQLKQEVVVTLRTLRDKLLDELRRENEDESPVQTRRPMMPWELEQCSVQQLIVLKASLQRDVHELSAELVDQLLVRDQLRTKQDALLLDLMDLT